MVRDGRLTRKQYEEVGGHYMRINQCDYADMLHDITEWMTVVKSRNNYNNWQQDVTGYEHMV